MWAGKLHPRAPGVRGHFSQPAVTAAREGQKRKPGRGAARGRQAQGPAMLPGWGLAQTLRQLWALGLAPHHPGQRRHSSGGAFQLLWPTLTWSARQEGEEHTSPGSWYHTPVAQGTDDTEQRDTTTCSIAKNKTVKHGPLPNRSSFDSQIRHFLSSAHSKPFPRTSDYTDYHCPLLKRSPVS